MSNDSESRAGRTLTVHNEVNAELWQIVNDGLDAFNAASAPLHDIQPLACAARALEGRVIGGVIGRTWGVCCEMLQLWVAEEHRRLGIGSALVTQFHKQAEARGCITFYLDTFSFQAPEFYRKFGYDVRCQLQGYSHDIVKYIMVREVVS